MTDAEVMDALIAKLGKQQAVAARLDESPQAIFNWRGERGIAWPKRKDVAALCEEVGVELPSDFLSTKRRPKRARRQRAA